MKQSTYRIKIIRFLIEINEFLFFYPKIRKFYRQLNKEGNFNLIFDVGTNKGQTIRVLKKINSNVRIFGFEPNRLHYKKLLHSKIKNLFMYNYGCSDVNKKLLFNENILDESSTFEVVDINSKWLAKNAAILGKNKNELIKNTYYVKCIRLSDFILEESIKEIDLIKIDVEGHETNVLRGLFYKKSSSIKYIQLESHNDDLYARKKNNDIDKMMKENGYFLYQKFRHGFGNFSDLIYRKN